ncbi:uncharacterized protein LOC129003962 [Macrosteles quadrilineatus]|uniref:uncharacterized protein LOC129003962 n=1 Tax=Macrosteles quadrilineatus TaxID=74068 RepID=UPI0023E15E02|nr:uncharacterized protein LOC129003962 [Macrosteles quadrilineatus]
MSGRSPNFIPSPRFCNVTPNRNQHFPPRQPLYLPPNSPFLSPRSHRTPSPRGSPRPSGDGSDFIPLGISSPVNRARQHWSRGGSFSNNSSYSTYSTSSTPSSFNSSHGYSPYKRHNSRGNFRGRGKFNHSGSGSPPIHLYFDKEALEDPWADLAEKLEKRQGHKANKVTDSEKIVDESSGSEVSEGDEDL